MLGNVERRSLVPQDSDAERPGGDGDGVGETSARGNTGSRCLVLGAVVLAVGSATLLLWAVAGRVAGAGEQSGVKVLSGSAELFEARRQSTPTAADQVRSLQSQVDVLNEEVSRLASRNSELEHQVVSGSPAASCTERCAQLNRAGRWRFGPYGHKCPDPVTKQAFCHCSERTNLTEACDELVPVNVRRLRSRRGQEPASLELDAQQLASSGIPMVATSTDEVESGSADGRALQAAPRPVGVVSSRGSGWETPMAEPRELISTADTIGDFCNATGLVAMHGQAASPHSAAGEMDPNELNQLESSILSDLAEELEKNNVDKAARDIFTFYMCLRWVPDDVFWRLARQEMAANLVQSVVDDKEHIDHAMSELYQQYKYVPMLCSENYEVFGELDPEDHTYFRAFKKKMSSLTGWLDSHKEDNVIHRLKSVDEIFCHGKNMNDPSCNQRIAFDSWMNGATSALGDWQWKAETVKDKWEAMYQIFQSFDPSKTKDPVFGNALREWKQKFPYHSFVHKPEGMPPSDSPDSDQRFLVCFGKRVASNLHRRPTGRYLMTDQNNIGCHGFWTLPEVTDMVSRMVELWKPPTCQLAEMTFVMKRRMLQMYQSMNERLFDALPTLLMDEDLTNSGLLEKAVAGPPPYNRQQLVLNGVTFVTGMRVRSEKDFRDPVGCKTSDLRDTFSSAPRCQLRVHRGDYGSVLVEMSMLKVKWDSNTELPHPVAESSDVTVVPHGWSEPSQLRATANNIVSGMGNVIDYTSQLMNGLSRSRYTSLATLMSNSTSKWVVCPVRADANYSKLDSQLGVEDAALRSIQQEAYAKWSGYQGHLPGEVCSAADLPEANFPGSQMCEISELHADHVEKYTKDDSTLEQFICPVKQNLPPAEQLNVLEKKRGQCFLHMTSQQQRQYQWPYNGDYPARRQYDRKANEPVVEYELIKLLEVPSHGSVSYARTCGPDEQVGAPRFCRAPKLYNQWPSAAGAAKALVEAAGGSLAVGAVALSQSVSEYADVLKQNKNATELMSDTANLVGEQMWDTLTGAGRLLNNAVGSAASAVAHQVPGEFQRNERLENEIFQAADAGLLLHTLSFQRPMGANGRTSNAKERFQRYVVTMPCHDFDPAMEFAVTKKWTNVALQMVQSAINGGPRQALEVPVVELALRGEGRLFKRQNEQGQTDTWFTYGGAMQAMSSHGKSVKLPDCHWNWGCQPSDECERSGLSCVPKVRLASNAWWNLVDKQLISVVAPVLSTGTQSVSDLYGITVALYCGQKSQFKDDGLGPFSSPHFLDCIQKGVQANARLRASQPWKLYWPNEVVVVAVFGAVNDRQCKVEDGSSMRGDLCSSKAQEVKDLDAHLTQSDKSSTDGKYQGMHAGAGFPEGTAHEVVLRPEDVLEAAGLLGRS